MTAGLIRYGLMYDTNPDAVSDLGNDSGLCYCALSKQSKFI